MKKTDIYGINSFYYSRYQTINNNYSKEYQTKSDRRMSQIGAKNVCKHSKVSEVIRVITKISLCNVENHYSFTSPFFGYKSLWNKAGSTANTSRGRMGRGGNACFPTFRLERDGPTDRPTDRPTDKASYRVACPQLKNRTNKHDEGGPHEWLICGTQCR